MAALQFVETPGYAALLLRRTFRDLNQPGALMPTSKEWLWGKASWNHQDKRWTFPSGATLTFGYLDHEDDVYQYQGSEFHAVLFDELSQFTEPQYRYLFSRLRRKEGVDVPLRMRAASNPGGVGHEWVKRRFITHPEAGVVFIPARLDDNPSLDRESYIAGLMKLDPITRAQLLAGDWDAYAGGRFRKEWLRRFTDDPKTGKYYLANKDPAGVPYLHCQRFTIVDPAASERDTADYTAIGTFAITPGRDLLLIDMVREHLSIDTIVPTLARVCERFKPGWVGIESIGFQAAIVSQARGFPQMPPVRAIPAVIAGMKVQGEKYKLTRATPAIVFVESGQFYLPHASPWLEDFEAELTRFTGVEEEYDDQVDCLGMAVASMSGYGILDAPRTPPKAEHAHRLYEQQRPTTQRRQLFGGGGGQR